MAGPYIVIPKSSANTGIGVDTASPTYSWKDLIGNIIPRSTGAGTPLVATYIGNIMGFHFAVNDFVCINYHIPHDYALGTDIFIHYHWSHDQTNVTGGTITWRVECTYAKGHNQAVFPATGTIDLSPTASTTQFQHMLSEVQLSAAAPAGGQLTTGNLEPDGLILAHVSLTANNITVSSGVAPDPFLHFADIHYQSTNIGTKQKAPNFYV